MEGMGLIPGWGTNILYAVQYNQKNKVSRLKHIAKMLAPWKKSYAQPRQHIKKQRHYFANKGPSSQSYGFSSSHVRMWEDVEL